MKSIKKLIGSSALLLCMGLLQAQSVEISPIQFEEHHTGLSFDLTIDEAPEDLTAIKMVLIAGEQQEYFNYRLSKVLTSGRVTITLPVLGESLQSSLNAGAAYCLNIPELSVNTCKEMEKRLRKTNVISTLNPVTARHTNNIISVDFESNVDQLTTVQLYDVTGKKVALNNHSFELTKGENHLEIPSENIAPGIYVISIHNQEGTIVGSDKLSILN